MVDESTLELIPLGCEASHMVLLVEALIMLLAAALAAVKRRQTKL